MQSAAVGAGGLALGCDGGGAGLGAAAKRREGSG